MEYGEGGAEEVNSVDMVGRKIFTMRLGNTRAVDSYNFLSMPLADFPRTFGLTERAKGDF